MRISKPIASTTTNARVATYTNKNTRKLPKNPPKMMAKLLLIFTATLVAIMGAQESNAHNVYYKRPIYHYARPQYLFRPNFLYPGAGYGYPTASYPRGGLPGLSGLQIHPLTGKPVFPANPANSIPVGTQAAASDVDVR